MSDIGGSTRVFLILGDPIAQVKAPALYNHLFRAHGIDAVLVPAQVGADVLAGFAREVLKARNIDGLWVTIPHKAGLAALVDRCDALGRVAGAVNAVRRHADGSVEGALFDGTGFAKALDHFGIGVIGQRVLIAGAGGAGMAIAASLAARGVGRLALFDATPSRAVDLAQRLRLAFPVDVSTPATADPAGFDLVVNATPLGLKAGDALPFDVARIDAGAAVVDILMTREPTPLLRACAARDIAAHPGHEMLVQQIPDYLSFFGFDSLARTLAADLSDVRALMFRR